MNLADVKTGTLYAIKDGYAATALDAPTMYTAPRKMVAAAPRPYIKATTRRPGADFMSFTGLLCITDTRDDVADVLAHEAFDKLLPALTTGEVVDHVAVAVDLFGDELGHRIRIALLTPHDLLGDYAEVTARQEAALAERYKKQQAERDQQRRDHERRDAAREEVRQLVGSPNRGHIMVEVGIDSLEQLIALARK